MTADPLLERLRTLTDLTEHDLSALGGVFGATRVFRKDRQIAAEGEPGEQIHLLVDGWAARSKLLSDGRRHLPLLLLPGDLCDGDGLHVRRLDYGVVALTECRVAVASRAELLALVERRPRIGEALTWLTFVENAVLTQSLARHGRMSAREHMAHVLCELLLRLSLVGAADENGFTLPITQEDLADTMGLTSVHVNRTLQGVRAEGLVRLVAHRLDVMDWRALKAACGFDPTYLHLAGIRPRAVAAG